MTTNPASARDYSAADFSFVESTIVGVAPGTVYDLISNVENIDQWSPTASRVAYDPGQGPQRGAWFSGTNSRNERQWVTRSQVDTAIRPTSFSFHVGGLEDGIVRWQWTFARIEGDATAVSLVWSLLRLDPVLGQTRTEIKELEEFMRSSVRETLDALTQYFQAQR